MAIRKKTLAPVLTLTLTKRPKDDQHPTLVYLARLGKGSRRAQATALNILAGLLTGGKDDAMAIDWAAVRYQHSAAVHAALQERYAPATANRILAAFRGVLREAWRLGLVSAEDFHRAADLPSVKGSRLPRGRALTTGELRALFEACRRDATPAGARDAALLALGYGAGLRRSELVAVDVGNYDPATGLLTIRSGKGRKDRTAYATNGSKDALAAWLAVRGTPEGPLFCGINKGGRMLPGRLSDQGVLRMLVKRAEEARIKPLSPHDLRRSFISDLLDGGADLVTVQALAGHANPATTARYDRRGEVAKQRAAELLHVPFAG